MRRQSLALLASIGLVFSAEAQAQWDLIGKAALPAVPYWVPVSRDAAVDVVPLLWSNEVDGNSTGCCVVGAAGRVALPAATLWLGIGFGTDPDAGTPAAIEAAAERDGGAVAFRELHGRIGFAAIYPVVRAALSSQAALNRISVGLAAVWLDDPRYLETVTFFDCPAQAPSVPCDPIDTPFSWSDGRDHSVLVEAEWGRGDWGQPRLRGSVISGWKVAGGEHAYLRIEAAAAISKRIASSSTRIDARLAGGWVSDDAPQQRRFLLEGADPITRWLNPYIDARGALFADLPYYVPGGPDLRAYQETRPLVKRYLAASGRVSGGSETEAGLWGRLTAYLGVAWTPGIPNRMGPDQMNDSGDLLFDWRRLPDGEGEEQGEFRARVLDVAKLWTDAGFEVTGGFRNVAATLAMPLWANQPAFAGESILNGEKRAFAFRWALTITFFPTGRSEL